MSKRNLFDSLRLLFAALVIVSHAPELVDGNRNRELLTQLFHALSFGELAVDSFFIISGYLIVQSWIGRPSGSDFLISRGLRIYPGFVVAMLVCAGVVGPLAGGPEYWAQFRWLPFLTSVIKLQPPQVPPVFAGSHAALMNGAVWTIATEARCYVLVLLFGLAGLFRVRYAWLAVPTVFLVAFNLHGGTHWGHQASLWLYQSALFGFGGSFFLYGRSVLRKPLLVVGAAALALAALQTPAGAAYPVFGLCWAYLLLSLGTCSWPHALQAVRLPDISYGVYLYAWPISKLLILRAPHASPLAIGAGTLALSVIAGILSWWGVERPGMQLKQRLLGRRAAPQPVPCPSPP